MKYSIFRRTMIFFLMISILIITRCVPNEQTFDLTIGSKSIIPPLTNGDSNWDEGFDCIVSGDVQIENQKDIKVQIYMFAKEGEPDWTTVEGSSEWIVYSAPSGWKIKNVTPLGKTQRSCHFNENENIKELIINDSSQTVKKFTIYGFRGTDPNTAGTYTSVTVLFNTLKVVIQQDALTQEEEQEESQQEKLNE